MAVPDQNTIVVDLRIPFFRLMLFFIKASLAAIPAAIIVGLIVMVLTAIVAGLFANVDVMMHRWSY